jgi:hypothetical protein
MSNRQMKRDELIAIFEDKAESPPSKQNELLMRHLKCKESTSGDSEWAAMN